MIGLLLTMGAVAVAQQDTPASEQKAASDADYRGYLDQARFFMKKGWFPDAEAQLEKAVHDPNGWADPEAWYMLATVRYDLTDIEGAREAASRAHTYSHTDNQLQQAAGFATFLNEQFGIVEIKAPYEGLNARLDIELKSLLLDPNLEKYLGKIDDRFKKKVLLPQRFGLPVGDYTINGKPVKVGAKGVTEVELPSKDLGSRGPAAIKLVQAELGVGVDNWLGPRVKNLRPSFDAQLSVSLPAGPLRIAAVFDWSPTGYLTRLGDSHTGATGGSLGIQVGWTIPKTDPIFIRPGIGYRYALVPGIELTCAASGQGYACGSAPQTDLLVYSIGRAHVPYVAIALGHLDERRTSDIGFGVKGVAEYAFGTLPPHGNATVLGGGTTVPYTTDPQARTWTAFDLRVLAHLSVAF